MDEVSFCWGFVTGALITGGAGFVAQRLQLAGKRARAADSKQAIAGQTPMTPREVVRQARRAKTEMAMWIIGLLAVVICIALFLAQI